MSTHPDQPEHGDEAAGQAPPPEPPAASQSPEPPAQPAGEPGAAPPPPTGSTPPPAAEPAPAQAAPVVVTTNQDARNWALGAHISSLSAFFTFFGIIAGPLIVWLVKKDADPYIDAQGKEAVNFNISVLIYGAGLGIASVVLGLLTAGLALLILLPALAALSIAWFVFVVIAAVKASRGEDYRYPLTIRFIS